MSQSTLQKMSEFVYERPDMNALQRQHTALVARFDAAGSAAEQRTAILDWQNWRREVGTQRSLANVRFRQDTSSDEAKAEKEFFDQQGPTLREWQVEMERRVLDSPHRETFTAEWGPLFLEILQVDVSSFEPAIADEMREESKLSNEYTGLIASATIDFEGETLNLSGLGKFFSRPDRDVRRRAQEARWTFFADHAADLDRIFDGLVKVRTGMGRKLGHSNFIPLAYQRMTRTEYGPEEVAVFRREVLKHIVPLAQAAYRQQAADLGLEKLTFADESLRWPDGNPTPIGSEDDTIANAHAMYKELGGEFHSFFEMLAGRGLMDLKTRPGKAGGGFCTQFVRYEAPFIFANFNGTKNDVRVLTHECGHAFQGWMSRHQPLLEYLSPTAEACEIHSMGLEFLTWPQMDRFFGAEGADRFRRDHLLESLQFIPYACTIDEFQHRVYENPDMTPAERHATWAELERTYLPHRNYDGLPHASTGGFWQVQLHLFNYAFYYIDYALALTGAMQLWERAQNDRAGTMQAYVDLCRLGGSKPYLQLLAATNLKSPFTEGTLESVVNTAANWLGLKA